MNIVDLNFNYQKHSQDLLNLDLKIAHPNKNIYTFFTLPDCNKLTCPSYYQTIKKLKDELINQDLSKFDFKDMFLSIGKYPEAVPEIVIFNNSFHTDLQISFKFWFQHTPDSEELRKAFLQALK